MNPLMLQAYLCPITTHNFNLRSTCDMSIVLSLLDNMKETQILPERRGLKLIILRIPQFPKPKNSFHGNWKIVHSFLIRSVLSSQDQKKAL